MLGVSFAQGIEEAWANVATFVPKLAAAVATLLVGWLVACALRRAVRSALRLLRFDDLVDRSGLGQWVDRLGTDDASGILARLVFAAVMLITLQLAVEVLGQTQLQVALTSVVSFLPKLAAAVFIVVITGLAASRIGEITERALAKVSYGPAVSRGSSAAVWIVGGFASVDQLGVAENIVSTLFQATVYTVGMILVIKFGVGGVASARDRFWPRLYDRVQGPLPQRPQAPAQPPGMRPPMAAVAPAGYYGYVPVGYPPQGWVPVAPRPGFPAAGGYPSGAYPAPGYPQPGAPRPAGQPAAAAMAGSPQQPPAQVAPVASATVAQPVGAVQPVEPAPIVQQPAIAQEIDLREGGSAD